MIGLRIVAVVVCSAMSARAIDPDRTTSQYVRQKWGTENGFPGGPVYSLAQTADGYLWIGTDKGLDRFDGSSFRLIQQPRPELPTLSHVLGMLVDREGSLWLGLQRPTLLRLQNNRFEDARAALGRLNASVVKMAPDRAGSLLLWVLQGEPSAIVLRGGKTETIAAPLGFSRSPVLALAQTQNGDLWVGTRDAGLFRIHDGETVKITEGLPDPKVNTITRSGKDELWIGTDNGIARWDGTKLTHAGVPASLSDGVQAFALLVDRDANLWVGTNSKGLARLNSHGVSWINERRGNTNDAVTTLLEDREGSLWAGTARGVERIRDSAFVTYSIAEGMPSENNGPVFADKDERLWFAPIQGGLYWLRDGKPERVMEAGLANDIVYSLAGGKDGLWVGRQRGGLTLLRTTGATTYTTGQGLAQDSVYSVHESHDGTVWAGTLSGGVSRLSQGHFTTYTGINGIVANTVVAIEEDSTGTMWFATPRGLSAFFGERWRTYGRGQGLPSENINCLLASSGNVLWIGTANGLAFWNGRSIQGITGAPGSLREQILGIAEDRSGSLWIATSAHLVRANRYKLIHGGLVDGDVREFTIDDGLRGMEGVKRSRSVVADPAGRIWFSMSRGISMVDPGRLRNNSAPALVQVQSVAADGATIGQQGSAHIPSGSKRVTLDFNGLSLSIPERVRYRYMLEPFDHDWSAPDTAREAVYTNLSPGSYRFRVVASNPDGVWSSREADLAFVVDPRFWQTTWFRLAILLAVVLTALAAYRLRLRQLTHRLNLRFEERLAERTRIAQELHDTLLQGFVSSSMQVHVAADSLPEDSKAKAILSRALQGMGQVIDEGRNTVRGLRLSRSASLDLEEAFARIPGEIDAHGAGPVGFRVVVDGEQRPLHPLLRDDVYRIGREALFNAFRHAQAKQIEVEIRYGPNQFRVAVRDDGTGIDPAIVAAGRDGHWGLSIMRERADRIGANFHVFSRESAGTEVELTIPGHLAFQDYTRRWLRWFASTQK
jgi:ligand-binding sensor domain-containing protein/signal transduction histidine kinase